MTDPNPPEQRVALYGGSFNPPHVGHLTVVSYVLATQPVECVWLMPCYQHAFAKALAPFDDRMEMTRRLADGVFPAGRTWVTDIEAQLGGESRTIDTVEHLMSRHPRTRFDLVVGTDIFEDRASWKRFDDLERLCRFIVVGRRGFDAPDGHRASPPLIDLSSTEVRERLAAGRPVDTLVPRAVAEHIDSQGLYR